MTSPDLFGLDVKRLDTTYRAHFQAPQFGLLQAVGRTLDILYRRFNPYGIRLADITVESHPSKPAEFAVNCALPFVNAAAKFRLESFELIAFTPPAGTSVLGAVKTGLEALGEIAGQMLRAVGTHQATIEIHGVLAGIATKDYLLRYMKILPWEPTTAVGVAFHLGPDPDGRLMGVALVAPSAVIPDGLYIQVNASYQGALAIEDVARKFVELANDALHRLAVDTPEMQA